MSIALRKAERKKAKLKLGISAPSGGGKTLGALIIAFGMMRAKYPHLPSQELWEKIAIVDTENKSGELYANITKANIDIGEYFTISLEPPFTPEKYIEAIKVCHREGIEVCILDSTTHAWAGQGGLLEQQGNIAKRTGNSYTAWRDVTPKHNQLIDTMLQTDIHIIATMRSKTEHVVEKDANGKVTVRKLGLAPVQRDGMEYEFTTFFDIDAEHNAFGSKDRTGLFDQQYFVITPETGEKLMQWLENGKDIPQQPKQELKIEKSQPYETEQPELTNEAEEVEVPELDFVEFKKLLGELCSEKSKDKTIGVKKIKGLISGNLGKAISETTEQDFDKLKTLFVEVIKL